MDDKQPKNKFEILRKKTLDTLAEKDFKELRVARSWCEESYQH